MAIQLPGSTLQLPSPHLFDILPALHEILARIDHASNPKAILLDETTDDNLGGRYVESQPLDPKDVPNEVLALKARIRKALRELEKLPDMDRSREQQMEEIDALEARRGAQEELQRRLAKVSADLQKRLDTSG